MINTFAEAADKSNDGDNRIFSTEDNNKIRDTNEVSPIIQNTATFMQNDDLKEVNDADEFNSVISVEEKEKSRFEESVLISEENEEEIRARQVLELAS